MEHNRGLKIFAIQNDINLQKSYILVLERENIKSKTNTKTQREIGICLNAIDRI